MYPTFDEIREMGPDRNLQKNSGLQRVVRRQLHPGGDDADPSQSQSSLLSAGKCQPE